jgi:hypothetical protein
VVINAADPLNLMGILLPGAKVPALATNRIVLRDGLPVAALVAGEVQWSTEVDAASANVVRDLLVRRRGHVGAARPQPAALGTHEQTSRALSHRGRRAAGHHRAAVVRVAGWVP